VRASTADDLPNWMQPLSFPTEPALPQTPPRINENSDLPPGLQKLINGSDDNPGSDETETSSEGRELPQNNLPKQAAFVAPSAKPDDSNRQEESSKINLEELSETVLAQFKKQRRHNDIVEYVCHQTGWHWNKSQRFVARVQTKNHEQLQSGQNRITIFIGIGIILIGLIIAFNGVSTISEYVKIAAFARTNPGALLNISPMPIISALAATITGVGMITGGGFGVGRALSNR
jgi:hypothetical protein